MRRARTLTLWLTPQEGDLVPEKDEDRRAYAADCAGKSLESLRGLLARTGAREIRIRVCRGIFFSRVVDTAEA